MNSRIENSFKYTYYQEKLAIKGIITLPQLAADAPQHLKYYL